MDTLELLKQLRFDNYESDQGSELASYNLVLHRQLDYIFQGFDNILENNRINYHTPLFDDKSPQVRELIMMIQKDMEYILQMSLFVIRLYYVDKHNQIKTYADKIEKLYDIILKKWEQPYYEYLFDMDRHIIRIYNFFDEYASKFFENDWNSSWESYENTINGFSKEFKHPTENSKFKQAFKTDKARAFRKKFMDVFELYRSALFSNSLLGDNLTASERELIKYIVVDLYGKYCKESPKTHKISTRKLTNILQDNQWEKIDYNMRCRLWELINNLVIRTEISDSEQKQSTGCKKTECDYSIINKYLRCTNEDDIRGRLELIEQKLKRPRSYRIMNILSDMTSFFDSPLTNEEALDMEGLTQFERELATLYKTFDNLLEKYDSYAVINNYIKDIYEADNSKDNGKMNK